MSAFSGVFGGSLHLGASSLQGMTSSLHEIASSLQPAVTVCNEMNSSGQTMHYLLMYDVVPDYFDRRASFRAEHLALARTAHTRGELVLGGALADPADGAVLLFKGDSPAAAEAFAAADPYVRHGLVTRWRVRKWATVVGDCAAVALPPELKGTT